MNSHPEPPDDKDPQGNLPPWLLGMASGAHLSKIKLGGGLVGRVCIVLMVLIAGVAGIAVAAHNVWIAAGSLAVILVSFLFTVPRMLRFAEQNPNAAMMEGAELLVQEQMRLTMKSGPVPTEELIPSTDPQAFQIEDPTTALLPDTQTEEQDPVAPPSDNDQGEC